MIIIRTEVRSEMQLLSLNYENQIKQLKSDFSEKLMDIYDIKEKYYECVDLA